MMIQHLVNPTAKQCGVLCSHVCRCVVSLVSADAWWCYYFWIQFLVAAVLFCSNLWHCGCLVMASLY